MLDELGTKKEDLDQELILKEEQKNKKMGTIIGTLTFEPARNTEPLGFYFYTCTKNIRTINKIHNL